MNFTSLPAVTPAFLHGFKRMLLTVVEKQAIRSVATFFAEVLSILRFSLPHHSGAIDRLTFADLARYAQSSIQTSNRLAAKRSMLKRWARQGFHGLDPSLATTFPACKHGAVHSAVDTQDPRKGPLDDQEFETVLEALNVALEKGIIELDRALGIRLIALLGMRPTQLAMLKCCDIKQDKYGRVTIDIPIVKGRDQATRDEFLTVPVEPTTSPVLWDYRNEVEAAFAGLLDNPKDAPLFPMTQNLEHTKFEPGLAYHLTSQAVTVRIARSLKEVLAEFGGASVRLNGEVIHMFPKRFRYSFAQRGADEGMDMYTLAHLLGHHDIKNVKCYFQVTDRIRARFSRKIVEQMAPLAAVFSAQQRILKDLSEATRPTQASRIPDLRLDQHGNIKWLASCASCSSCSQIRPYACLAGCLSFEPFLDADLEPVLDRLISEREARMDIDERIAKIRDRAIYGCAQIILRQRELRAQEGNL